MAPTSGLPEKTQRTIWSLQRSYSMPFCMVTDKVILPFTMAWRKRTDFFYGPKVYCTLDKWVTKDSYLVMKLKGEV